MKWRPKNEPFGTEAAVGARFSQKVLQPKQTGDKSRLTLQTSMAGVSRVSPVSFLNAKPIIAIFFPEIVLNMASMTRATNLCFW